jgi:hypothetical protein
VNKQGKNSSAELPDHGSGKLYPEGATPIDFAEDLLAAPQGFEPRYADPESACLDFLRRSLSKHLEAVPLLSIA